MSDVDTLFDLMVMEEADVPASASPRERALAFHAANPAVYVELRRLAFELLNAGHRRFGIDLLFSQMRWRWMVRTSDESGFRLNNSYRATYARLLAAQEPELSDVFNVRSVRA